MVLVKNSTTRFWLVALAALGAILWLFRPVMLPFLVGLAMAYFLEPAVSALERKNVRRWLGASIVLSGFLFVVVSIFLLLWPMLVEQAGALLSALPEYTAKIRESYLPWVQDWLARFSPKDVEEIRNAASQSTGTAVGLLGETVKRILNGGFVLVDAVALSILAPVTAFYALRDWKRLIKTIDQLIPRRAHDVIREQLLEIDRTLSGFLRGQAIVCVILGLIYSVGLAICGLHYGVTVGLIAGALTIIPYVGTVFGWATSAMLAFVQFEGDFAQIGMVVAVFAIGNVLETYVLTPRLVGKKVGLHPLWILFALISGIKLMGFLGALIAVPTAAVLGVLVRFGARQYRSSAIYQ